MPIAPTCLALLTLGALMLGHASHAASPQQNMPNPDFTQGGKIPDGASHDWNLGATGARGWMFSQRLETTHARQIVITRVDPNSPADGILREGDVILGIDGKPFTSDPRPAFGRALTTAEAESGTLRLLRWRDGADSEVVVQLPVLGRYSATAPFDCPKSARILDAGCKALAARIATGDYARRQNPITRSLNALALLASGDPQHLPIVREEAKWASGYTAESFQTWYYAYVIMFLAEYQIATGDNAFERGLKRLAMEAAKGQSHVGSWGHGFAMPDGRLMGYGMMNAPGVPLTISLELARRAGLKDPALDLAIDRSAKLLRFYIGKGAVPYGDHHPWTENHEDNGKSGMAGVLFNLLGEKDGPEFFSRLALASHGPERDTGHTGNFTNILWSMPGVALAGPHATGAWMREFGAWYYDLARTWDGAFPHQGPPEMKGDSFNGWDATGGYLIAYAMPRRKILLAGKQPNLAAPMDAATAQAIVLDGRGWSNNDRHSAYDALTPDQLLERLASWSPTVRERAAEALRRRKGPKPIAALTAMLRSPDLHARLGACVALKSMGPEAAPAVPEIQAQLKHPNMWLRVLAADALAHCGEPGMVALPELLEIIAKDPGPADPRGMEQRFMCFAVFGKMLKHSAAGADPELLSRAVRAGLLNQDGRARGQVSHIYQNLGLEQIRPLLPAIFRAIQEPAPSGEMFAEEVRLAGLELLGKHHVREGMAACADHLTRQTRWASEHRTPKILEILEGYGKHARTVIPTLKKAAADFEDGESNFPMHLSRQKAQMVRESIRRIEAATASPALIRIK